MRIKGIKPVTVRKRGRVFQYYYHRATSSRIVAAWGTAEFAAEVARLDAKARDMAPKEGSLGALIIAYRSKDEYKRLAQRTRSDYDKVFDWLSLIADMPLAEIDGAFVYDLRDKALTQRKRRFANYVVQVVRLLLKWGKSRRWVDANAAEKVETIPRPKAMPRANRPWTDDEREMVLTEASVELRAVIALAMFAGLREGDGCRLPKLAYDGRRIETVAAKNGERVWIPAHFRLREALDAGARARREKMLRRAKRNKVLPLDPATLAVTSRGKSWTSSGFRASFFKLLAALVKDGRLRPGLTYHGLRHTLGKLVIEAGGSKEDVGIILGDRSMAMMEFYSREHEKEGRATAVMLKLEQSERRKMANRADASGKPGDV